MIYDFAERLLFSKGARKDSDIETIMSILDGCTEVLEHQSDGDDKGVDYVATLRRGTKVLIDAKTRETGCSRFWKDGNPELAIESWSVAPGGKFETPRSRAKAGWTLDEAKLTDMILYTFSMEDCGTAFLLPFQPLRMAARRNLRAWMDRYKVDTQTSGTWQSEAVFVPADVVILAMESTYRSTIT